MDIKKSKYADMYGAYAAMYTPYKKDGSVNEEMIEKQIEYGLKKGLRGFYLTGSTGEGLLLTAAERKLVYNRAVKVNRGRGKLIAHVCANTTAESVELAKAAEKAGCDWISAIAPVQFGKNFPATYNHYAKISNATGLPFMAYCWGEDINPDQYAKFFELKNVKGLKYTAYKYWTVQLLLNRLPKEIALFAGADEQVLNAMASGIFTGCIGTSDNMVPGMYADLLKMVAAGEFVKAQKLMSDCVRHVELMIASPNWTWHKSMMKYLGLDCGNVREPWGFPMSKAEEKDLFARMDKLGYYVRNEAKKIL